MAYLRITDGGEIQVAVVPDGAVETIRLAFAGLSDVARQDRLEQAKLRAALDGYRVADERITQAHGDDVAELSIRPCRDEDEASALAANVRELLEAL
jgi:hypothetical protein